MASGFRVKPGMTAGSHCLTVFIEKFAVVLMPLLIILRASPLCRIARHVRRTLRMSVRLFACSIHLLARLYFLYSARLTFGSLCSKLCSVFLSAALAQTLLFYLCLYFLFVFYLSLFYFCALAALRCLCAMSALTLRISRAASDLDA